MFGACSFTANGGRAIHSSTRRRFQWLRGGGQAVSPSIDQPHERPVTLLLGSRIVIERVLGRRCSSQFRLFAGLCRPVALALAHQPLHGFLALSLERSRGHHSPGHQDVHRRWQPLRRPTERAAAPSTTIRPSEGMGILEAAWRCHARRREQAKRRRPRDGGRKKKIRGWTLPYNLNSQHQNGCTYEQFCHSFNFNKTILL